MSPPPGINRAVRAALTLVALGAAGGTRRRDAPRALPSKSSSPCAPPRTSAAHTSRVERVLRTRHDVLGQRCCSRAPGGPTYEAARRLLPPLLSPAPPAKAADRLGRVLPPVRPAAGAAGRGRSRCTSPTAARWSPAGRRPALTVSSAPGRRALRLVPRAARLRAPRRRLPPHPRRRYVDAAACATGRSRSRPTADGLARQLRAPRRDARRAGDADRLIPSVRSAPRARLPRGGTAAVGATYRVARHDAHDTAWSLPGRRTLGVDAAPTSARDAPSRYWTGACARGRRSSARAARHRRLPRPADPEPAPDVALQHRQPVRGVLVPRGRRRRAGDGRAGLRRRRARRSCARR